MSTFNPEALRALAAAAEKDGQHIYTHWRDSNAAKANEAWHKAASPELFVGLLDRIAALEAQQTVPHGWKLAPIEPTEAQLATVRSQKSHPCAPDRWDSNNRRIYMHMLAAAPLPPGDDTEVVAAKPKHQDYWICLLCGSSRPGHHRTLDDGTTPCPNKGRA